MARRRPCVMEPRTDGHAAVGQRAVAGYSSSHEEAPHDLARHNILARCRLGAVISEHAEPTVMGNLPPPSRHADGRRKRLHQRRDLVVDDAFDTSRDDPHIQSYLHYTPSDPEITSAWRDLINPVRNGAAHDLPTVQSTEFGLSRCFTTARRRSSAPSQRWHGGPVGDVDYVGGVRPNHSGRAIDHQQRRKAVDAALLPLRRTGRRRPPPEGRSALTKTMRSGCATLWSDFGPLFAGFGRYLASRVHLAAASHAR